jgi:hypothetical protein
VVINDAWLNPHDFSVRISFDQVIQVFRKIYDHRHVAALSSQASSAASAGNRNTEFPADCDCFNDIRFGARNDNADRYLPIVGAICRVKRTTSVIKTHLTADGVA